MSLTRWRTPHIIHNGASPHLGSWLDAASSSHDFLPDRLLLIWFNLLFSPASTCLRVAPNTDFRPDSSLVKENRSSLQIHLCAASWGPISWLFFSHQLFWPTSAPFFERLLIHWLIVNTLNIYDLQKFKEEPTYHKERSVLLCHMMWLELGGTIRFFFTFLLLLQLLTKSPKITKSLSLSVFEKKDKASKKKS